MCAFINTHLCIISRQKKQISTQELLFRNVLKMMCRYQVKSARSEMASGTPKTDNFMISRVILVMISMKEATFGGLYSKEDIVDAIPVDNEETFEGEGR